MKRIYLDHIATTPVHPEVFDEMRPYFEEHFGNPQSLHRFGDDARKGMENARTRVAALINARPEEIFFTSSGTESNNFALKGFAGAHRKKGNHIVVSAVEHHSVLYPAKYLEKNGFEVARIPVDGTGLVDTDRLRDALTDDTILVSVMYANSEVGTIQPIDEIGKIVKERGIIFHTDAVDAAGLVPIDVESSGIDSLSIAASQFYGPKGVGALYIRKGVRILPFMEGGIQENGRRPGTENVPGIVGMGKAAELAQLQLEERVEYVSDLRDRLVRGLRKSIDHLHLTGHPVKRLPNHASFSVEFIEGEAMLLRLNMAGIAVASGSSCTSRALKTSHVLTAMGIPAERAQGSIVFSLGTDNTEDHIDHVIDVFPPIVETLRGMSPLYATFVKGSGRK
jgi:cysteine desulfurase